MIIERNFFVGFPNTFDDAPLNSQLIWIKLK